MNRPHVRSTAQRQRVSGRRWQQRGARLPDGGHGEVELDKDGAEGEQASSHEEHGRMAGPVRRRDVARDLVGARRVRLDLLL